MDPLSEQDVRRVARLSKLELSDEEVDDARTRLSAVIEHFECLDRLDLENVEPMPHAHDETARLAEDEPAAPLDPEVLERLAPKTFESHAMDGDDAAVERFIAVPKVLDPSAGGGGA
ncbi:MAG: Asp-tRNA(Asn)/Glu-tRNA(Gln) amidotransferase subunit GatC [Planctomycetota bacterium]